MAILAPDPPARARRLKAAALALLVSAAALFAVRRSGETEEDRVRAVLDAVEAAVEERDLGGVLEHISKGYRDADGLDRDRLKLLLLHRFLSSRDRISLRRTGGTDVALRPARAPQRASAGFRARISDSGGAIAALGGEAWDFEVDLRREEDGVWRVASHRRRRAPE